MKMSPIKKIVIGLAAITVALSLITANNMASVMLIVASREAGSASQQTVQTNKPVQQGQSTNNSQGATSTGNTATDNTASDNTATTSAATDNTATTSAATDNKTEDKTPADDKKPADDKGSSKGKPETKAEIVEYFNTASNKVKTNAKSVTKDKEENYQAKDINLGALGALQGMVNGLINDNMGVNEEQSGRTGTTVADKNAIYPVENEAWSSKLTVDDIEDATCTEKNGVYTITIKVKNDELATEYAHGTGHHGKAFNIVMPQTIKDNAGAAGSLLSSLKVGYENGTIVATVDAATGNIISAKYDFVWLLNIDMFGGITAYFGIKTDYSVKW